MSILILVLAAIILAIIISYAIVILIDILNKDLSIKIFRNWTFNVKDWTFNDWANHIFFSCDVFILIISFIFF